MVLLVEVLCFWLLLMMVSFVVVTDDGCEIVVTVLLFGFGLGLKW
jgi:hypothetical protein